MVSASENRKKLTRKGEEISGDIYELTRARPLLHWDKRARVGGMGPGSSIFASSCVLVAVTARRWAST